MRATGTFKLQTSRVMRSKQPRIAASDYALMHGGHLVRLGPIAFWICTGSLVIMAGWTLMTATYFAFQDDVLTRLVARQAEMQFAYEDRIADMRAQVDRVTSRQLLDQEQIEQKLDQIARKQATLESRSTTLSTFADPTVTGSIRPSVRDGDRKRQTRAIRRRRRHPVQRSRGAARAARAFRDCCALHRPRAIGRADRNACAAAGIRSSVSKHARRCR